MSSSRTARNIGKRRYAENSGSDSDQVEEKERSKFTNKRRKNTPVVEHSDDEEGDGDLVMEDDDGKGGTKKVRTTSYEAGQILRVEVENFMCHRRFHVTLGKHLNFITGRNGSGKSAIVAAIQLCLGSNARQTGRGSNLGKYIREGSEANAVLKVTLLNRGPDAYKPDEYGKKIIVKRTISKQGSNYQLLDENEKEVSKSRSELDKMLKDFNIYVDTPCCVLTQEESKRLIHGSAKEKYEFFIKATGLKNLFDQITAAEDDQVECSAFIEHSRPQLNQLKMDRSKCKKLVEDFQALDHIDDQIRRTTAMIHWSDVREANAIVEGLKDEEALKRENVEKAQADYDEAMGTGGANKDTEIKRLEAMVDATAAEQIELKSKSEQKGHEIATLGKNLGRARAEAAALLTSKKEHEKQLKDDEADLKELKERAMHDADKEEREVLDLIEACNREIEATKAEMNGMESHRRALTDEGANLQKELNRCGESAKLAARKISDRRAELEQARNGRDRAAMHGGPKVTTLLGKIQQEKAKGVFKGPVLGPLGAYITIREGCDKWSRALESGLGPNLRSFVVTTVEDRNILKRILSSMQMDRSHSIVTQYSCPRYPVHATNMPGVITMVDALQIDEDLIFNCLLDQINMDRVGLVEAENTVTSRFVENVNGEDRLMFGLNRILTLNATTISYRGGNESSEVDTNQARNCLASDDTAYLASLEQAILGLEINLRDDQQAQKDCNQQKTAHDGQIRRLNDSIDSTQKKVRVLNKRKQELDSRYMEVQEAGRVDHTELEARVEELKRTLESLNFELDRCNATVKDLSAEQKLKQEEHKHFASALADLSAKTDAQTAALNAFLMKCKSNDRRAENMLKVVNAKKKALDDFLANVFNKEVVARDGKLELAEQKTAELVRDWDGEPLVLSNKETTDFLGRRIKKLQTELEEGRRKANLEGYTAEILLNRYEKAKEAFAQKRDEFQRALENKNTVEEEIGNMKEKWEVSFRKTNVMIRKAFDMYAQKQGAAGSVEISAEKQEMKLVVRMDNSDPNSTASDVKNLSGGERSYVTLCLLLALGHVTESPFRLLDEYDVFMDEGRRNHTLQSIQEHCMRSDQFSRQMIVITPNTLASVKTNNTDKVRIHKMPDPVKQSAHGLQQQTID